MRAAERCGAGSMYGVAATEWPWEVWEFARKRHARQCEFWRGLGALSVKFFRVGRVASVLTTQFDDLGVTADVR